MVRESPYLIFVTVSSENLTLKKKAADVAEVVDSIPCIVKTNKKLQGAWRWWLKPEILATQEGEIRSIAVRGQPEQIVGETILRKPK
jgi:hypothetical protein